MLHHFTPSEKINDMSDSANVERNLAMTKEPHVLKT